jgi:transcriptional regulator with XRE-family HTH domain
MTSLSLRVRALVDKVHGGKVNAAATDIGIAQSTLAQIVSGEVKNPRANALAAIAGHYGASLDWLMAGAGARPEILDKQSDGMRAMLKWRGIVRSMDLPEDVAALTRELPHAMYKWIELLPGLIPPDRRDGSAWVPLDEAIGHICTACSVFFAGSIEAQGTGQVRDVMVKSARVLEHFTGRTAAEFGVGKVVVKPAKRTRSTSKKRI